MTAAVARPNTPAIERALVQGDLSGLSDAERIAYYQKVCDSLGLNPFTKPFNYLKLSGKTVLYATKDCADQLRANRNISIRIVSREEKDGILVVTARASTPDGREDEDVGAVNVKGLQGDALANAHMKALTKSKRRVTLSICGLGFLDESELETITDVRPAHVEAPPQIQDQQPKKEGNGIRATPTGEDLERSIRDLAADWEKRGFCEATAVLEKVREWAASHGCRLEIKDWPEKLRIEVRGFLQRWLNELKLAVPQEPAPAKTPKKATKKMLAMLDSWCQKCELSPPDKEELCSQFGVDTFADLNEEQASSMIGELADAFAKRQQAAMQRQPGDEEGE